MPLSEQEQADLTLLLEAQKQLKIDRMEYMLSFLRYTPDNFKHSGYPQGLHQAIESVLRMTSKELDKLTNAHIKKYPD